MKKHSATKIIATLGPSSSSLKVIFRLLKAGTSVFRLNLSHGDFSSHENLIKNIRKSSKENGIPTGIMIDLPGPKVRLGDIANGPVQMKRGQIVKVKSGTSSKDPSIIPINYPDIHKIAGSGKDIFINDGIVRLSVKKIESKIIECRVEAGGEIDSRKGVNIPGGSFSDKSITAYDKECVRFGIKHKVDFFAMSFVRKSGDLKALRRLIKSENGIQYLIAKIEKPEAIDDFDNILDATDGIMLARGDLGIEIPIEKVPVVQKDLLGRCNDAGIPVITATQVLDSMVKNPRPTRAEAADAANAILDKTDALMLSQETAIGKYPVEAVRTLRNIASEAESILKVGIPELGGESVQIADCVARSVVETARDLDIRIILTPTRSGRTARLIARYRPGAMILAISEIRKTAKDLLLTWGVETILMNRDMDLSSLINKTREVLLNGNYAKRGERFIITSGSPVSEAGETNLMVVETV